MTYKLCLVQEEQATNGWRMRKHSWGSSYMLELLSPSILYYQTLALEAVRGDTAPDGLFNPVLVRLSTLVL